MIQLYNIPGYKLLEVKYNRFLPQGRVYLRSMQKGIPGDFTVRRELHYDSDHDWCFTWKKNEIKADSYIKLSIYWALARLDRIKEADTTADNLLNAIIASNIYEVYLKGGNKSWRVDPYSILEYDGERITLYSGPYRATGDQIQFSNKGFVQAIKEKKLVIDPFWNRPSLELIDHTEKFWKRASESKLIWDKNKEIWKVHYSKFDDTMGFDY